MSRVYFFTGSGVPTSTPTYEGSVYVDTTNDRIYFATGTSSSSDWDLMPVNLSEITIDGDLDLAGVRKIKNALGLDFQASTELTISSGAITQTQTLHSVDTELDASTDLLDSITAATDINFLALKLENSARVVTLKHNTGNLHLPNGDDIVMGFDVIYVFIYDGTNWILSNAAGQIYKPEQSLADGANIAWDLDIKQNATVTLAGNRTLDNPTNMKAGAEYMLRVVQDGTGSRTLSYGAAYKWPGGTAPTLTTTAAAVDTIRFYSDGSSMFGEFTGDWQ